MRLANHAFNKYSQFGEDGMIEHVFEQIGTTDRFCVEFGAADGVSCSNTKRLRDAGWSALLIEADPARFADLVDEAGDTHQCVNTYVTPENLDHYIAGRQVDFMSIDVDGDDYEIFAALEARPKLVCIEYNASIPPHISLRQSHHGDSFGASARALVDLARTKGYELLEVTRGNLLFVAASEVPAFSGYDRSLESLYDRSWLTYVATDYGGHPIVVGATPPWGLHPLPYVGTTEGDRTIPVTLRLATLIEAFELRYGPAKVLEASLNFGVEVPDKRRVRMLERQFSNLGLLVIDITNHNPTANFDWILRVAETCGREAIVVPAGVIAITPRSAP